MDSKETCGAILKDRSQTCKCIILESAHISLRTPLDNQSLVSSFILMVQNHDYLFTAMLAAWPIWIGSLYLFCVNSILFMFPLASPANQATLVLNINKRGNKKSASHDQCLFKLHEFSFKIYITVWLTPLVSFPCNHHPYFKCAFGTISWGECAFTNKMWVCISILELQVALYALQLHVTLFKSMN
jgi:hypothetical protein